MKKDKADARVESKARQGFAHLAAAFVLKSGDGSLSLADLKSPAMNAKVEVESAHIGEGEDDAKGDDQTEEQQKENIIKALAKRFQDFV